MQFLYLEKAVSDHKYIKCVYCFRYVLMQDMIEIKVLLPTGCIYIHKNKNSNVIPFQ